MRTTLLITVVLAAVSFASCKRENYTCVCQGGFSGSHYEEKEVKAKDVVKARKKCVESGNTAQTPDGIYCDLKP